MTPGVQSRRLKFYQRLVELSRDLISTLDLDALLKRILQAAEEVTDAEASSILLWDEKKQELVFQAARNPLGAVNLRGVVVPVESLGGWVALNRQTVMVADAHQDTRFFSRVEKTSDYPTHSLIAVPMSLKEKLVGVLEVLNKRGGTFDEEDQHYLEILSAQAAVAVENARLFQQSDLVAELVHEIRTPLTSIGAIATLLQRPDLKPEQRQQMMGTVMQETRRLEEMASTFLDLARLESGRASFEMAPLQPAELAEECRAILEPRARQAQVELFVEFPASLPAFRGDHDKMKQVLLNLGTNAIKYNRPGGRVTLSASACRGCLLLQVEDTGLGMSPEEQSMLFRRFYRAPSVEGRVSGTGLGLTICKHIVEGHNGAISVHSQPGVGTTFTVQLPLDS